MFKEYIEGKSSSFKRGVRKHKRAPTITINDVRLAPNLGLFFMSNTNNGLKAYNWKSTAKYQVWVAH